MKTIKTKTGLIEGKERLLLYFDYDQEVIALIKTIPGARWHPAEKCWHVSVLAGPVEKLSRLFEGKLCFEPDMGTGRQGDGGNERTISPSLDGTNHVNQSGDSTNSRSGQVSFVRDVRKNLVPVEFIKTLTLKNYAPNTIRTYKSMMQEFLEHYPELDPAKITEE